MKLFIDSVESVMELTNPNLPVVLSPACGDWSPEQQQLILSKLPGMFPEYIEDLYWVEPDKTGKNSCEAPARLTRKGPVFVEAALKRNEQEIVARASADYACGHCGRVHPIRTLFKEASLHLTAEEVKEAMRGHWLRPKDRSVQLIY